MKRINILFQSFLSILLFMNSICFAEIGLWTSAAELASKPTTGEPWQAVMEAAAAADPAAANVSNQDSNNNAEILAAAIVYARTGDQFYKDKVIAACEKLVAGGQPEDRTLAWARETGAYVLAADLVNYRTSQFELWLRNMAEVFVASDNRTLLGMFHLRPNNWGTMGFGSLCAIYGYLEDMAQLSHVRDYWIQSVTGPKPANLTYGNDLSWHVDQGDLRLINPKGSVKQGLNIDGILPDDMRRNGSFSNPPPEPSTSYHWEVLQGIIMGARILERAGMPIWMVADSAIYRAVYILQTVWENAFGGWKAEGDDLWMLPFIDDTYGTDYTEGQPLRVWKHGKNVGWGYVIWNGTTHLEDAGQNVNPNDFEIFQNYPNPFNPSTTIRLSLIKSLYVALDIFDLRGRRVSTLMEGFKTPGIYYFEWIPGEREVEILSSGIYFCQLRAGGQKKLIKMIYSK